MTIKSQEGIDGLLRDDYRWDIDRIPGFTAHKQVPLRVFEHLMDDGLSREDLALLFVLLGHKSKNGVCNPSQATIAHCLGWQSSSRSHVQDVVERLEARNVLRVTRTKTSNRYDLNPWLHSFEKYEIKRAGNGQEMFVAIPCYVLKHGPRLLGIPKFLYILLLSSFINDSDDDNNHGVVIDKQAAQHLGYKTSRQITKMRKELEEEGYLDIEREGDFMVFFSLHGIATACRDESIRETNQEDQQQHSNALDSTLCDAGLHSEVHQTPQEVKPNKAIVIKPLLLAKARNHDDLTEKTSSKDDMLTEPEDYDWSFHFEQADNEAFYDEDTAIWKLENLPEHQANRESSKALQTRNYFVQNSERSPSLVEYY